MLRYFTFVLSLSWLAVDARILWLRLRILPLPAYSKEFIMVSSNRTFPDEPSEAALQNIVNGGAKIFRGRYVLANSGVIFRFSTSNGPEFRVCTKPSRSTRFKPFRYLASTGPLTVTSRHNCARDHRDCCTCRRSSYFLRRHRVAVQAMRSRKHVPPGQIAFMLPRRSRQKGRGSHKPSPGADWAAFNLRRQPLPDRDREILRGRDLRQKIPALPYSESDDPCVQHFTIQYFFQLFQIHHETGSRIDFAFTVTSSV